MLYQLSYASKWDMPFGTAPCHTNPFFFNGTIIKGTIAVIDVQERAAAQFETQPVVIPKSPRFPQRGEGPRAGLRNCREL
jgi:hypothetical protein